MDNIIAKYPDKILFEIIPNNSNGHYVVYSFPLVINNTYKVIINNKAAIFKITNFITILPHSRYGVIYYYKIDIINSGNIRNSGIYYADGKIFVSGTGNVINNNDTSFQLSVQ